MDKLITAIAILLLAMSCAQQRTPTGGPVDVTPPQILSASPAPMQTNFTGDRIEILFDEYVELQGVRDEVLISPPLAEMPEISIKGGKRLIVDLSEEELNPNTTYTINFGQAIRDIRESNPLEENVFLFSTGEFIDTLSIEGLVYQANSMAPCKDCKALLYQDVPDTVILANKPRYMARTDEQGRFQLDHLAAADYRLFAVQDRDNDLKIDLGESRAFYPGLIQPGYRDSLSRTLLLFQAQDTTKAILDYDWAEDGRSLYVKTQGLESPPELVNRAQVNYVQELGAQSDSIRYWLNTPPVDLEYLVLNLDELMDTINVPRTFAAPSDMALELQATIANEDAPLLLSAETPLTSIDLNRVVIKKDSTAMSLAEEALAIDGLEAKLALDWEEGMFYELELMPGAVTDAYGSSNDSLTLRVLCPEERSFGTLTLNVSIADSSMTHYLYLKEKKRGIVAVKSVQADITWTIDNLNPGEYRLLVVGDQDEDGQWTSGNFNAKRLPEPVYVTTLPITVRANWELEQEVEVVFPEE